MNDHVKKLAETFGQCINNHRRANNLSAKEVGEMIRVHDSSISNWERGEFLPSRPNYENLVALFPELKDADVELAITCEVKPGGAPNNPNPHRTGSHGSPKFAPIRKPKGRDKLEAALFPKKRTPVPPKKREPVPPKKREPVVELPQEPEEGITVFELFGHILFEIYGKAMLKPIVSDRTARSALIRNLREAGVPDSAITDIIHDGLG